jgi:hypothetical protein
MTTPDWQPALTALLGHPDPGLGGGVQGAELVVSDPADPTGDYRAALARHHRLEPGDPPVLWIRPLNDGYTPPARAAGEPDHRFSLNETRRRGIAYRNASLIDGELHLDLVDGRAATIRPVQPDLAHQLDAWDTFVTTVLPANVEAELDQLVDDSWTGTWS